MRITSLVVFSALSLLFTSTLLASSIEKATMLNKYGLTREAKVELIDIVFSTSSDSDKAQAHYLLGSIAFEEKNVTAALDSWRELSKRYPNSEQAKMVQDRINILQNSIKVLELTEI